MCGEKNEQVKELSVRVWECSCGVKHQRDENAAKNILQKGMEELCSAELSLINMMHERGINVDLSIFLTEMEYVDFSSPVIRDKAEELFCDKNSNIEKAKIAYEYVRDEIPHSFDIDAKIITAKASDVLIHKTGICHAKANLLAALLRLQGIPTGFCFQHLTLADDDSLGYCVHCYNAVFIGERWIKLDARGNKPGVNAQFSLEEPMLAFPVREEYDEYYWEGIYATPNLDTMKMLEKATSIQDIIDNIPYYIIDRPDIFENNFIY